ALSRFIVDQNILYFGTFIGIPGQPFTGKVYAYNIQSNKQLWSTSVPGGVQEPFAASNGTVYTAVDQGRNGLESHLIALNAATGKIVWKQPLHTIVLDGFSMSNGIIFVGSKAEYSTNGSGSGVQAFNARTGQVLWKSTQYGYQNIVPTA
ncbi:MAG: PQQ-binding-like beta-propeller repeat protein, partial [Ktedonobacteraceae bacterium]|nr:PQQ-binding-like beta-propeller repeat protein [Ktedonobacteraceae bacterium]